MNFLEVASEIKTRLDEGKVVAFMNYPANSYCESCDKERNKVIFVCYPEYTQKELDEDYDKHCSTEGYMEADGVTLGTTCINKLKSSLKSLDVDLKLIKKI